MGKKQHLLNVQGVKVAVQDSDYISLTDIAKSKDAKRPSDIIARWLRNQKTLLFLQTWEIAHNSDFNHVQMDVFRLAAADEGMIVTAKKFIEGTNAIGLKSKAGRYGGTYAHKDVAIAFCYWLSPVFQVYLVKEFDRLKRMEFEQQNLEWHVKMITDRIDDVRNLLDTIPGQHPAYNRILDRLEEEE